MLRSNLLVGILCLGAAAGCGTAEETQIELVGSTETVINDFSVAGEQDQGISAGFNLDGLVSDFPDGRSCYQQDYRDENGMEGIDPLEFGIQGQGVVVGGGRQPSVERLRGCEPMHGVRRGGRHKGLWWNSHGSIRIPIRREVCVLGTRESA